MKRYLKLFVCLIKNNLIRVMEYRGNFLISSIIAIFWVLLQLWIVDIYFGYTDNILGWARAETFLLIGLFRFSKGFFDIFIRQNLFDLPEAIGKGGLDYSLTRPVNSLFLMSFRRHVVSEISTLISGSVVLVYSLGLTKFPLNPVSLGGLAILVLCGLIAYYSIFVLFATLSIFTTRLTAISSFQEVISQIIRYPTDVFTRGGFLQEILFIPFLITFTLPAKVLLGKLPSYYFMFEILAISLLFLSAYSFWNFALKRYSSASS